jgi:hypothetical protein
MIKLLTALTVVAILVTMAAAGMVKPKIFTVEAMTVPLTARRGPRGSGAGARASHPSRAAVFTPPYKPSG